MITSITSITSFTSITGNKDIDLIVLFKLNNKKFFIFCKFRNKYINKLCKNESLWRERLFKYYGQFYPEETQSWKNLYLSLVIHMDKYKYRKDQSSFMNAIINGHLDVVKYLMSLSKEYKINPSIKHNLPIRNACFYGHLSVVKYLISLPKEYKISPNAYNNYAIINAIINYNFHIVKYLIGLSEEYGIDPHADNNYAIKVLISRGEHHHLKTLENLIGSLK